MRIQFFIFISLCLTACEQGRKNTEVPSNRIDSTPVYINAAPVRKKIQTAPFPRLATAHPAAQALLNENFFFSPVDEAGPFGNSDGMSTYSAFADWRLSHKENDPALFLQEEINVLGYPKFDLMDTSLVTLIPYLQQHEFGSRLLSGTDASILAIAFGQLYLEGSIDAGFKEIAKAAVYRQLIPELLALWGDPYRIERKSKLTKMLAVLNN